MYAEIFCANCDGNYLLRFLIIGDQNNAKAMPMFGRKYGVSCAVCHTSPPRLNETGYKFRAAGFRFPQYGNLIWQFPRLTGCRVVLFRLTLQHKGCPVVWRLPTLIFPDLNLRRSKSRRRMQPLLPKHPLVEPNH